MPSPEAKRLFLAVELPESLKTGLREAARKIRAPSLRWTPSGQLHLTLNFIGDFSTARLGKLVSALSEIPEWKAFPLEIAAPAFLPNARRPNVLCAGLRDSQELRALKASIDAALEREGVPREASPFRPHITVARVRDSLGFDEAERALKALAKAEGLSFNAASFALFSSVLRENGALHSIEASFNAAQ